jgi:hypothetical protein
MLEKEARINRDYADSRHSSIRERNEVTPDTPSTATCCSCGVRGEAVLMGHVGDGLYKCAKCLGVANA